MKKARIVAIGAIGLCAALIMLSTSDRLWWTSSKYQLEVNGRLQPHTVYHGKDAVLIRTSSLTEPYLVYPGRHEMGVAQNRRFLKLPGCVLSLDAPAIYIPIGKFEVPVESEFNAGEVRFRGVGGEKVILRW